MGHLVTLDVHTQFYPMTVQVFHVCITTPQIPTVFVNQITKGEEYNLVQSLLKQNVDVCFIVINIKIIINEAKLLIETSCA